MGTKYGGLRVASRSKAKDWDSVCERKETRARVAASRRVREDATRQEVARQGAANRREKIRGNRRSLATENDMGGGRAAVRDELDSKIVRYWVGGEHAASPSDRFVLKSRDGRGDSR